MSARSLKGLSPASQAQTSGSTILGLTPQALRQRPLRGLKAALIRQVYYYPLEPLAELHKLGKEHRLLTTE